MPHADRSRGIARWTMPLLPAALCLQALALALPAQAQTPMTPEGIWYTKGRESIIRVRQCAEQADAFCGSIVWMREPNDESGAPKVDKYNRDPAKRNKPMLGTEILLPMTPEKDHWVGHAYNPEDGKTYDITFKVTTEHQDNDTADLRGCVLGVLCRTEQFSRAAQVPGGDPTVADASGGRKHRSKQVSAHR